MVCIPVLGTARSGTSFVAGTLHLSGIPMKAEGNEWLDPLSATNYPVYEDSELIKINDECTSSGAWTDEIDAQYHAYFEKRSQEAPLWGFKAPRSIQLWPMIWPILTKYVVELRPIYTYRLLADVVRSVNRHRGTPIKRAEPAFDYAESCMWDCLKSTGGLVIPYGQDSFLWAWRIITYSYAGGWPMHDMGFSEELISHLSYSH